MLGIFRNNQLKTVFAVIFYNLIFLLGIYVTVNEFDYNSETGIWYIKTFLENISKNKNYIFGIFSFVIIVQALYLNSKINYYHLGKRATYFTAIFYPMLFYSIPFDINTFEILFSNFFMIMAIDNFYKSYEQKNSVKELFNASFFTGTAILIYPPTFFYIFFVLFAWLKLRTFNWKEFFINIIAITLPFYFYAVYAYLNDFLLQWGSSIYEAIGFLDLKVKLDSLIICAISIYVFHIIYTFANYSKLKFKTNIKEQKFIDVILIYLMCAISAITLIADINIHHILIIAMPLSVFTNLNCLSIKKNIRANILHMMFLLSVLYIIFFNHIYALFIT